MKLKRLSLAVGILALCSVLSQRRVQAIFTSKNTQSVTASANVGGPGIPSGPLTLNIPSALHAQTPVFFGKNVVIPLELQGSAGALTQFVQQSHATSVGVQMVYQLFNAGGSAVSGSLSVPVAFQPSGQATVLSGNAIILVQNLQAVRQGGSLALFFVLQNGAQSIQYRSSTGAPYQFQFVDTWTQAVDASAGAVVTVPDPALNDGKTQLVFAPGALSGAGTVVIHQVDALSVPGGPGSLLPVVVYDFQLQGTSLAREVGITLTYPSNLDGSIIGTNGNPASLAPYWLQGPNWLVMGPRQWDGSRHTVSITSPHFSTFALFLSGATGAADLRPRQRILTPNGDGINDTIDFSGIGVGESVHLFDVRGRRVRTLQFPTLVWDGRDDNGSIVESGLYIYQYTSQGERVSGVILVAK